MPSCILALISGVDVKAMFWRLILLEIGAIGLVTTTSHVGVSARRNTITDM
jgi:hypothetical protein